MTDFRSAAQRVIDAIDYEIEVHAPTPIIGQSIRAALADLRSALQQPMEMLCCLMRYDAHSDGNGRFTITCPRHGKLAQPQEQDMSCRKHAHTIGEECLCCEMSSQTPMTMRTIEATSLQEAAVKGLEQTPMTMEPTQGAHLVESIEIARCFHENYERLAPTFDYETRRESRVPFDELPAENRGLMIATASYVRELIDSRLLALPPEPMTMERDVRDREWCRSFDAKVWTAKWLETIAANPSIPTDEGTMLGWFANAIMAGYDYAKRAAQPPAVAQPEESMIETAVGGVYAMADGRQFWIDGTVAREIAKRAVAALLASSSAVAPNKEKGE